MGQVTAELVGNALKHAFEREGKKTDNPSIIVKLDNTASKLSLNVKDNGFGMKKDAHNGNGEGLVIINNYADILKGNFYIKSSQKGTHCSLNFIVYEKKSESINS